MDRIARLRTLLNEARTLADELEAEYDPVRRNAKKRAMRTPVRLPARPGGPVHGTRTLYGKGCRCDPCTDAESAYSRELRRRKVRA